jgi:hypothetical protein
MKTTAISMLLVTSLLGWIAVSGLRASEIDKKTFLTFPQPVEIPGMVLPAGDYVLRRADRSLPDVVQFVSSNERHVYATTFALPTYRSEATDEVVIVMEERPANAPEAIKKWFYPGDTIGAEFVYPKSDERLLAMAVSPTTSEPPRNTPLPAPQNLAPAEASSEQPVESAETYPQPVEVAQAAMPQTPARPPDSGGSPSAPATSAQSASPSYRQELPETASNLPFATLLAMLSLIGGGALRRLSRRSG